MPLEFCPYDESATVANIVVDGSPNAGTVLTLTHWPGIAQPPGLTADLSAEMAFRYLDQPPDHPPASVVTNNHFDQDGLVGIHALLHPKESIELRSQLIDVAAGGDFATYRHRVAARASMAIWAYAQPDISPLGAQLEQPYPAACALLYETVLPLLVPMIRDSDRFRDLWQREDAHLTAAEEAVADGRVRIDEVDDIDLAVVTIECDLEGGHRFASDTDPFIHPMAINNATDRCRLLLIRGHEYLYRDRYETWVQYQSRSLPRRVDLAPLAERLNELEPGPAQWIAKPPSTLTPTLAPTTPSRLDRTIVEAALINHLQAAPPAWFPDHL